MDRQIWRKAEDIPLFSIIVFSERCDLKKVTVSNENVKVIKRDRMYNTVKTIWDAYPDVLSKEQINELTFKLKELTNVDEAVKKAHVENIEKKYDKKPNVKEDIEKVREVSQEKEQELSKKIALEVAKELSQEASPKVTEEIKKKIVLETPQKSSQDKICPRCGGKLVLRTAKKGANAGKKFYGCERFPKCRYIENSVKS